MSGDAISELVGRIFETGRLAEREQWDGRSVDDFLANFEQDVLNLVSAASAPVRAPLEDS